MLIFASNVAKNYSVSFSLCKAILSAVGTDLNKYI